MKIRSMWAGVAIASIALVALSGCGDGGGSNGGATGPTVGVTISGAQWVAFQDGKTGSWRTVSTSGGFSGNLTVNSADGRYSLAWVCPGDKPVVHVVHATRSELPNLNATCPSTSSGTPVDVTVVVQELPAGSNALTGIGETTFVGSGQTKSVPQGTYDVISTRYGAGDVPNKVWIERNKNFSSSTTYTVDFNRTDGSQVRVIDVSAGEVRATSLDADELVVGFLKLENSGRSSFIGLGQALGGSSVSPLLFRHPIIPSNILFAGEYFRLSVRGSGRGEERILRSLESEYTISLPPPFNTNFRVSSLNPVAIEAIALAYSESPIRGYQMTIGSDSQQARWQIYISSGWLGNDTQYVSPGVIQTLTGWNPAWTIQSGSAEVSFRVWVSENSSADVLNHALGRPVNPPFTVRFAVRSQTIIIP